MKIAVTIAGNQAKSSAFVVWRGFEESIRKAAAYGYDGVELALKNAEELDRRDLRRWLKESGVEVSCITTGQVFADTGLYFTHPDPEQRAKVKKIFYNLIDFAEEFCGLINVGRTRGFIACDQNRSEVEDLFAEVARDICDYAAGKGVQLLVEPVNRYEINFINSLDDCAALLEKIDRKNCGIHADVFHMNIEDDWIGKSLIRNGKWVRYIHFADSNRLAPGLGHLDFDEVMRALETIEYNGWVSMEILPGDDPDAMAKKAIDFIRPKVEAYNSRIGSQDLSR